IARTSARSLAGSGGGGLRGLAYIQRQLACAPGGSAALSRGPEHTGPRGGGGGGGGAGGGEAPRGGGGGGSGRRAGGGAGRGPGGGVGGRLGGGTRARPRARGCGARRRSAFSSPAGCCELRRRGRTS